MQTSINFRFPLTPEDFQIGEWPRIKQVLNQHKIQTNTKVSYKYILLKKKYLYVNCRTCKAQLKYTWSEDTGSLKLYFFNNVHIHKPKTQKAIRLCRLQSCIQDLPDSIDITSARNIVKRQLFVSDSQFYYMFQKVKNPKKSFADMLDYIERKYDCDIITDPFEESPKKPPHLLIIITPTMRRNFELYSEVVGFDFTYNLIKERTDQGKQWRLGVMMGFSLSKRLTPFALVVTADELKDTYYQVFSSFITCMKKEPNFFITDESISAIGSLKTLNEQGICQTEHLMDCYHILKNIRKRLTVKQKITYFRDLIHAGNEQEYEIFLKEAYENLDEKEILLLQQFILHSNKYCFSQISKRFLGFSSSDSMNEKVHDLIKARIPYSENYNSAICKTLGLLEELGEKANLFELQKIKVQSYVGFPELKLLRNMVDKRIFKEICQQFRQIYRYICNQTTEDNYFIGKGEILFKIYKQNGEFKCTCGYTEKTQLPCSHLMKLCIEKKLRLESFVGQRWKIQSMINKKVEKRIPRRKTRRNRLR